MMNREGGNNQRLAIMLGMLTKDKDHPIKANIPSKDRSQFSLERYKFFLEAKFEISNRCCGVMKKEPAHRYTARTGRYFMTAEMASESKLRTQKWLQNGCNGFDLKIPKSTPMAFWTEQDILLYIWKYRLPICSLYGEVVTEDEYNGQLNLDEFGLFDLDRPILRTTGCSRTGCALCAFGAHCESKKESRFIELKKTHPGMYNLLDVCENNGVTYREAIEWYNDHITNKRYKIWI